ncbi:TetR/AcrR family transcriptional regulator [Phytohabitans rumicis]|uniref:TetR family transcriptional regulator n=1 Tax=Phytohabitans rumicis TaxID=1076125 RepID=A0A6V8LJC6_9ACTN|nr:TetR/AcrR family transcriptional regulator [Phytohabitans rumicis]GFJ95650.1 TetR family transcriptional regulator [Phytohabitans rumicis]
MRQKGRPPLTERRKAATRLEIARAAVRLFTAKGAAATSAEEIAEAAGISVRTLWRYFPTKEGTVLPLLAAGIESFAHALRTWPAGAGVAELLDAVDPGDTAPTMLALVRLIRTEPGLRAVWLQAHHDAEPVFAEALARRAGLAEPDLPTTVRAAMINTALRIAVEQHAFQEGADAVETVRTALLTAERGL